MFQWLFWKRGKIQIKDLVQGDEVLYMDDKKIRVLTNSFFPSLLVEMSLALEIIEHA